MAVTYKKLWHMLLDRNMKKKDLREAAGITNYVIRQLTNDFEFPRFFNPNKQNPKNAR